MSVLGTEDHSTDMSIENGSPGDGSTADESTAESEQQGEYEVEKILCERIDKDGITKYLLKWHNYPLYRYIPQPSMGHSHTVEIVPAIPATDVPVFKVKLGASYSSVIRS